MQNIILFITFIVGLGILTKGADLFVDVASTFAKRLGIPGFVVGLTVVALGTSAPEAAISIFSSAQATNDMAIANALGSNIVNLLVVLGVMGLVAQVPVSRSTLRIEMPFVLASSLFLTALCFDDGVLHRVDGLILLVILVAYLCFMLRNSKGAQQVQETLPDAPVHSPWSRLRLALGAIVGVVAICAGAQLAVSSATALGRSWGISHRVLGLTVVALGTSLPELVTSLTAARKGHAEMGIGNVLGSCILNVLLVLGLSGLVSPLPFAAELLFDMGAALIAAVVVWLLCLWRQSLGRVAGLAMVGAYAAYLAVVLVG